MITITFQCTNLPELAQELQDFLKDLDKAPASIPVKLDAGQPEVKPFDLNVTNGSGGATPQIQPPPEKKTRKKRETKVAAGDDVFEVKPPHDANAEKPTPTENVGPAVVNKEAVHQALQQVNISVGLPKAREILQHFKVNRISEIKEDQFKAFIEKCNEATMLA